MRGNLSDYFSKNGLSLRNTLDKDVNELVEIINDAYSYQDEAKGGPRTDPDHLRKRIGETDFYTVLHDKHIIGCVYLEPKGQALHFGLLTVTPDYRGKSIAKTIIDAIDMYAKSSDFETIDLDYMSLAPWLKSYYEKHGFVETGEVRAWGSIDLVRMQKRVRR
jgi:N-acetylglutamate synthase-like GNAT family acetyltransferase